MLWTIATAPAEGMNYRPLHMHLHVLAVSTSLDHPHALLERGGVPFRILQLDDSENQVPLEIEGGERQEVPETHP
jgi:hypothetical protein